MEGGEGDPKRFKLTPSKPVHGSEGESSETKRFKAGDEKAHVERRVQATEVGNASSSVRRSSLHGMKKLKTRR